MAILHAFRALRPRPDFVTEVACVPYDVINASEARQMAAGKPYSFLRVIRPEIDLEPGVDEHADEVYERGAANLHEFANSPFFLQEDEASLYVYRLTMDGRSQSGIFGCVAVADYDNDVILKHEKTRPDKEDDRTRHILAQNAHAEPVMLTFKQDEAVVREMEAVTSGGPLYDFVASDGVSHTVWRADNPDALVSAFANVTNLYVADGHHRCKAASRTAESVRGLQNGSPVSEVEFFPAVLFPMDQMRILPYNRVIYNLPDGFEAALNNALDISDATGSEPEAPGYIRIYYKGRWLAASLPQSESDAVVAQLDVARLGEFVLEPLFGITDPRRDANIGFVGGIRGTKELERLVDSGTAALAISMYATSIKELVDVSDAGLLMPPKSTWFEPKLRSGLLVHLF